MRAMKPSMLLAMITVAALFGCERPDTKQVTDQVQQLAVSVEKLVSKSTDGIREIEVIEEVKKLRQLEYKVFTHSMNVTGGELETTLNQLGKERWDCFHVTPAPSQIEAQVWQFFCKRMVETPLRYLPSSVVGR